MNDVVMKEHFTAPDSDCQTYDKKSVVVPIEITPLNNISNLKVCFLVQKNYGKFVAIFCYMSVFTGKLSPASSALSPSPPSILVQHL